MEYRLTLYGQPITKKNSSRAFNGVILPSLAYTQYEKDCHKQLKLIKGLPHFNCDVEITCLYYMKNKRRPDVHNLMQATADIIQDKRKRVNGKLVVANEYLLEDDSQIVSWDGTRIAGIDKENPRTEITIRTLE